MSQQLSIFPDKSEVYFIRFNLVENGISRGYKTFLVEAINLPILFAQAKAFAKRYSTESDWIQTSERHYELRYPDNTVLYFGYRGIHKKA